MHSPRQSQLMHIYYPPGSTQHICTMAPAYLPAPPEIALPASGDSFELLKGFAKLALKNAAAAKKATHSQNEPHLQPQGDECGLGVDVDEHSFPTVEQGKNNECPASSILR